MTLPDESGRKKKEISSKSRQGRENKDESSKQEERIADRLSGSKVPGSGGGNWKNYATHGEGKGALRKGDIDISHENKLPAIKVEAKTTKHKSFRITEDTLKKAYKEAMEGVAEMALAIEIRGLEGKPYPHRLVAVSEEFFKYIVETLREE